MLRGIRKVLKLSIVLLVLLFILDMVSNFYVIHRNSKVVSEDDSKIPVIRVSNQEIILEGGVSLEKERISDYIVVNHDIGVFYIPSEKALTVEWDISSLVRTIVEYSVICSCCIVLLVALRSR